MVTTERNRIHAAVLLACMALAGGCDQAAVPAAGPVPPGGLSYSSNPATYTRGTAIRANSPTSTGGAVGTYSVSPALPAGLTLDAGTGVISGTPTTVAAPAGYTVTATNAGGSTTASLSIRVNDVPPSGLTYATNPGLYTTGVVIPPNPPSVSGGPVVSYSVSPELPPGLVLGTTTGVVSGTPAAMAAAATYVITASNTGGSAVVSLVLWVNIAPPVISYASPSHTFTKGVAISPLTPGNSGGAVAIWAVIPDLPAGLAFSTSTGTISGVPTVVAAAGTYVVTATNAAGISSATLSVTVDDVAPSGLTYSSNPAVYKTGRAIPANTPSSSGGAVVSYSVAPALPAGLSINTSTGVITGTPTVVTSQATYTVTATNTSGNATAGVSVTVEELVGRFAYVSGVGGSTLTAYSIDGATGAFTPVGDPFPTGGAPYSVAVDTGGRHVYVACAGGAGGVDAFSIDGTTGALTPIGSVPAGAGPISVAVDPLGRYAYAANNTSADLSAFAIDATTGALAELPGSPFDTGPGAVGVAVHPSGKFVYVANFNVNSITTFQVDASTGALTRVGSDLVTGAGPLYVTVDFAGKFAYVTNWDGANVSAYGIDASTGALTEVPGSPFPTRTLPASVVVDPAGKFAYVANSGSDSVSAFSIDGTTGSLTAIAGSPFPGGAQPTSLSIDPSGKFIYVAATTGNYVSVHALDAVTGSMNFIGTNPSGGNPRSIVTTAGP